MLIVLAGIGLFAALAGYGMYYLYKETYPSIDDMQRLIHNAQLTDNAAESGDDRVDQNNPILKADLRPMYETIHHIVDTQNASWSLFLQYVVSIVIGPPSGRSGCGTPFGQLPQEGCEGAEHPNVLAARDQDP